MSDQIRTFDINRVRGTLAQLGRGDTLRGIGGFARYIAQAYLVDVQELLDDGERCRSYTAGLRGDLAKLEAERDALRARVTELEEWAGDAVDVVGWVAGTTVGSKPSTSDRCYAQEILNNWRATARRFTVDQLLDYLRARPEVWQTERTAGIWSVFGGPLDVNGTAVTLWVPHGVTPSYWRVVTAGILQTLSVIEDRLAPQIAAEIAALPHGEDAPEPEPDITDDRKQFVRLLAAERDRQITLWGDRPEDNLRPLLTVLMEELGEVAANMNREGSLAETITELSHVAATASWIAENALRLQREGAEVTP